jgi:hypothetical protein
MPKRPERCFKKVPLFARVTVVPAPPGAPIEAQSVEVGIDGVGLLSALPLPVGEEVSLTFHLTTGSGSDTALGPILGRVTGVWLDDDTAVVGVAFAEILSRESWPELIHFIEDS